jgi:hypothetical protein
MSFPKNFCYLKTNFCLQTKNGYSPKNSRRWNRNCYAYGWISRYLRRRRRRKILYSY